MGESSVVKAMSISPASAYVPSDAQAKGGLLFIGRCKPIE
jgi:hypothetical protein